MTSIADGHGGIASIAKTSTSGLVDTYTITYADTTTSTFEVMNGAKGDTGDSCFLHIKYASDLPTSDADMSDSPDNYIGIRADNNPIDPTSYTQYIWFKWKGEQGDTGEACTILSQEVGYMASSSGTVVPEGSWSSNIPTVPPGNFLWTRTRITYNSGDIVTSYSVSRNGIDGQGAVASVNELSPDPNGNISLTASDIPTSDSTSVQQHITDIEADVSDLETYEVRHITATMTALPLSLSYSWITAQHRVINCVLGTPSALASDLTWTTSAGDVTFSGTLVNLGSTTIDFDIVKVAT